MELALGFAGIIAGLLALVTLIGCFLPKEHSARRTLHTKQAPEKVWEVVTGAEGQTGWRFDLTAVERQTNAEGRELWLEKYVDASPVYREFVEATPPSRLLTRFRDEKGEPMGQWEYDIAPADGGGARVTITERGVVANPFFRFLSRYVLGHAKFVAEYQRMLALKLNQTE